MKRIAGVILLVFLTLSFLVGCEGGFNYYEDKLYSEKIIIGNQVENANNNSGIITRENAIQKAADIFDKGLNISIDRSIYSENVRLYRDNETDSLRWQITWFKADEKIIYTCILDSSNGEVLQITNTDMKYSNGKPYELNDKEINEIIKPLFDELSLDVNDYKINQGTNNSIKRYDDYVVYYKSDVSIFLVNPKDMSKIISISINPSYKTITSFTVITGFKGNDIITRDN